MSTDSLYGEMNDLWESFQENHTKFLETSNKAAGARARKAIGSLKKLVTAYRKASVSEA
tara:strand:- start:136 stop:312 length:177 start_codon:yes stop_codon:yes gene_type:complete